MGQQESGKGQVPQSWRCVHACQAHRKDLEGSSESFLCGADLRMEWQLISKLGPNPSSLHYRMKGLICRRNSSENCHFTSGNPLHLGKENKKQSILSRRGIEISAKSSSVAAEA